MNTQPKKNNLMNVQYLTQLAILVAVEIVMKLIGLGSVPVGPLYMSFLTVPIAVGAIVLGPLASTILGGVFGFVSFMDAIKGASIMTSTLLGVSAIHTFILCVGMRLLMGFCVGMVSVGMKKACRIPRRAASGRRCPRRCSIRCSSWATLCWRFIIRTMCRAWSSPRARPIR